MMKDPNMMKNMQSMMGGMGGATGPKGGAATAPNGGMNPNALQELMANPSIGKLIDNPELLDSLVSMVTNPAMRPQIEAMSGQTGMKADTIISMLKGIVKLVYILKPIKRVLTNPIVYYGLIIMVISYVLKWIGITNGHFISYFW